MGLRGTGISYTTSVRIMKMATSSDFDLGCEECGWLPTDSDSNVLLPVLLLSAMTMARGWTYCNLGVCVNDNHTKYSIWSLFSRCNFHLLSLEMQRPRDLRLTNLKIPLFFQLIIQPLGNDNIHYPILRLTFNPQPSHRAASPHYRPILEKCLNVLAQRKRASSIHHLPRMYVWLYW